MAASGIPFRHSRRSVFVIFFTWMFPANQVTFNWNYLLDDLVQLRVAWEYSHAANAVVMLIALRAAILSSGTSALSGRIDRWARSLLIRLRI